MRAFQLSLRTAIAVPFAVLFAATVGLQAVTQHRQISHLIDQESVRLLDALTSNSRARLAEFLETPFLIQSTVADAISRHGLYREGDLRPVYTHLRGVFSDLYAGEQQISLLSFGSQAGEYTGIRREPGEGFRLILKDATTNGMMNVYEDDTLRKVAAAFPRYDPRVRPWYAPVATSGQARWSPIYTTAGERGDITISAATARGGADLHRRCAGPDRGALGARRGALGQDQRGWPARAPADLGKHQPPGPHGRAVPGWFSGGAGRKLSL